MNILKLSSFLLVPLILFKGLIFGSNSVPCCPKENTWTAKSDLLYWRALAINEVTLDDWNVGYRIGVNYSINPTNWDASLQWTDFSANSHFGHHVDNDGKWKINLKTIEFTLGYKFQVNDCFFVKPYGGIQAVQIKNQLDFYIENIQISNLGNDLVVDNLNSKAIFKEVGPKIGLEADLTLPYGFTLFGNISSAIMYGHFSNHSHFNSGALDPTYIIFQQQKRREFPCLGVVDGSIGIKQNYCFAHNVDLFLQLEFEHHRFFTNAQWNDYTNADWSDLYLDGISFSVGISY